MHIVVEGEAYDKLPTDTCWNTQSVCWSPLCLLDIVPFHSAWSLSAFTDCRYTNMPHWNVSDLIGQKIHFYRSGPRKRFWKRKKKKKKTSMTLLIWGRVLWGEVYLACMERVSSVSALYVFSQQGKVFRIVWVGFAFHGCSTPISVTSVTQLKIYHSLISHKLSLLVNSSHITTYNWWLFSLVMFYSVYNDNSGQILHYTYMPHTYIYICNYSDFQFKLFHCS